MLQLTLHLLPGKTLKLMSYKHHLHSIHRQRPYTHYLHYHRLDRENIISSDHWNEECERAHKTLTNSTNHHIQSVTTSDTESSTYKASFASFFISTLTSCYRKKSASLVQMSGLNLSQVVTGWYLCLL